jgi:AmmeMemoRadiSam system protein A
VLTSEERHAALATVRRAVEAFVRDRVRVEPPLDPPFLLEPRAAFVSLRVAGRLRGCVGVTEPVHPLGKVLVDCAVAAATEDTRFPPVIPAELPKLAPEISLLSPLREIATDAEVRVGIHGLLVEEGTRRGLLLPQVPVEQGWDREAFLGQACRKAGLPADAWLRGARLFVFTAEVFGAEPGPQGEA